MRYRKVRRLFAILICTGVLTAGSCMAAADERDPQEGAVQTELASQQADGTDITEPGTECPAAEGPSVSGGAAQADNAILSGGPADAVSSPAPAGDTEVLPADDTGSETLSGDGTEEMMPAANGGLTELSSFNGSEAVTPAENASGTESEGPADAMPASDERPADTEQQNGPNMSDPGTRPDAQTVQTSARQADESTGTVPDQMDGSAVDILSAEAVPAVKNGSAQQGEGGRPAPAQKTETADTVSVKQTAVKAAAKSAALQRAAEEPAASEKRKTAAETAGGSKRAADDKTVAVRAAGQRIPDGVYSLLSALNPFKAIDIYKGRTSDRANAQVYDLNNSKAQHFQITYHPEDGTYSIMNVKSGRYLDVAGAVSANGTNVQQYNGNNTLAQRWVARELPDGSFTFLSALGSSEYALDLSGGASANGTNLQIYRDNGSAAQKFFLQQVDPSLQPAKVSSGIYVLESAVRAKGKAAVDIEGARMEDGANVQLYDRNGSAAQQFSLVASKGGWRIMSCSSGRVISIQGGTAEKLANVQQEQSEWLESQKWVINDAGDGTFYIKSADEDLYLDVAGGRTANRTNIQLYTGNGTNAQKFRLVREETGPVDEGVYLIRTAADDSKTVDIRSGAKGVEANAQLYLINGTAAQKFRFVRGTDGLYTIVNIKSGHALDVAQGSADDWANVRQYRINNSLAQKWIPRLNNDGSLRLINAKSGKMLDIANGLILTGNNIQQNRYIDGDGQLFRLEKTSGTVTEDLDYSVEPPPLAETYPQAWEVLKQVGNTLQAAEKWAAGLRFVNTGMTVGTGIRNMADYGFTTLSGDCNIMSAVLYEMAKVLQFDAHYVTGYVPNARGTLSDHTWLEIDMDGETYVCDPAFRHSTGKNGYLFKYRTRGTWRYSDYYRVN